MFFVLGKHTWTHILTHQGPWDPTNAVVWCVWTAFATLAGIGIIRPVKMLPMVLLEIFYKVLWLILVAYPLWSKGTLAGSPAEGITSAFLWVLLPIRCALGLRIRDLHLQTQEIAHILLAGRAALSRQETFRGWPSFSQYEKLGRSSRLQRSPNSLPVSS
jgi:hypothetical protein